MQSNHFIQCENRRCSLIHWAPTAIHSSTVPEVWTCSHFCRTPGTISGPRSALEPWQSYSVVGQIGHFFFKKNYIYIYYYSFIKILSSLALWSPAWAYWLSSFIRENKQGRYSSSKITTMEMCRLMRFIGMAIAALLFFTPFTSAQSPSPAPAPTSDGLFSLSLSPSPSLSYQ